MSDKSFKDGLSIGGVEMLASQYDATDVYDAMGIWWAEAALGDPVHNEEIPRSVGLLLPHIGGFAVTLARLARVHERTSIQTTERPEQILRDAAMISRMPFSEGRQSTFPLHSQTLAHDSMVLARLDPEAPYQQVWPPLPPSRVV